MEISSLIFSVLAFIFSTLNLIELRAQKLSTHQVAYVDPLKDWEKEMEQINVKEKEINNLDNVF
jgi:hypothetical protein